MTLTSSIQREERAMWNGTKYWLSLIAIISTAFIIATNYLVRDTGMEVRFVVLALSIIIGIIFVFFPVALLIVSRPDGTVGE